MFGYVKPDNRSGLQKWTDRICENAWFAQKDSGKKLNYFEEKELKRRQHIERLRHHS